jgi:hypothetical protein
VPVIHPVGDEERLPGGAAGGERLAHRISATVNIVHDPRKAGKLWRLLPRAIVSLERIHARGEQIRAPRSGTTHDGIDVGILVIGLFAVGETLYQAALHGGAEPAPVKLQAFTGMSREEWRRSWRPWLRGTAIGFPLGVLPMGGSVIPTFLSYLAEKRLSTRPEEFGHGAIEGVAGPEAANKASTAASEPARAAVWELAARAPAAVRPAFIATIAFVRATRLATRANFRGLPKDSR